MMFKSALLLVLVAGVAGCASSMQQLGNEPTPDEIPALEARSEANPDDAALWVRLGRAHRANDDLEASLEALHRARNLDPERSSVVVHLGLTHEAMGRPDLAREVYADYAATGSDEAVITWIDERGPELRRQELIRSARSAARREAELVDTPPQAGHVAVFPFVYTGTDPQFTALGRGISELLVYDLSVSGRLTLLERIQVQAVLDELELAEAGRVDPVTATRSGRILGAEHSIMGVIDAAADRLNLEASVVQTGVDDPNPSPISREDDLVDLFDVLKEVVLQIHRDLGIELTAAEEERVLEYRTRSLDALLAFSEGLLAEDRGNFAEAAGHFRSAVEIDPGFGEAEVRAVEADNLTTAQVQPPSTANDEFEPASTTVGVADLESLIPDPLARDAVAEATGQEGVGRRSILELIIRRP